MDSLIDPEILLVDDNLGDLVLIEEMIDEAFQGRARVSRAETLKEVIGQPAVESLALILLDLALPDSWGPETYRRVRGWAPEAIIVILSGNSDETMALQLVGEGAQDYLVKGHFGAQDLRRVISYGWERTKILSELAEQKAWWEALFRAIPDGTGHIRFANQSARRLMGIGDRDLSAVHIQELHPEEVHDLISDDLSRLRQRNPQSDSHFLRQLPLLTASGTEIPCEVARSAVEKGNEILTVNVLRDIRERRSLEKKLLQTQKMEALGQLTAGIAHDFNNLLGIALGNLDLLRLAVADREGANKRVATAMRALQRGAELTNRLLSFSRNQELAPHKTSLEKTIRNFIDLAARTIGPSIKVEARVLDSLPEIYVDQGELENVLLNLTVNAKDAMPEGGLLLFEARRSNHSENEAGHPRELSPGDYVLLTVTDTGCGMPQEVAEKAFEPFFTTKGVGKGTGLGLSMVYGFMNQTGGTVSVYSEVNVGTSFRLYFPVATDALHDEVPLVMEASLPTQESARLLVVDDEAGLAEVASSILRDAGHIVVTAFDGESALELFVSSGPFEILVTDILMPGKINGFELAVRVKALQPDIRVVFTSGSPARALEDRSMVPNSVLVTKPYDAAKLLAALDQVNSP